MQKYLSPSDLSVVYGTVTSNGNNAVDVALGTGTAQSGWTAVTGDATFSALGITGTPGGGEVTKEKRREKKGRQNNEQ